MSGEITTKSRRQSQAETRAKLIKSAERLMIAHSIPALSVRQLCADAGFTQGAFYSNFESKELLLLEVMEGHLAEQRDRLEDLAASIPEADIDQAMQTLAAWLADIPDRQAWAALALELQLYAFRNPEFRAQYKAAEARVTAQFRVLIEGLAAQFGQPLRLPADVITETLLILWHTAVLRSGDGTQPEESYVKVFRQIMFGEPSAG